MSEFSEQINVLSNQITQYLEQQTAGTTAWDLKLQLKAPLSQIYLALGTLLKDNRIRITPEQLTYRIQTNVIQLSRGF